MIVSLLADQRKTFYCRWSTHTLLLLFWHFPLVPSLSCWGLRVITIIPTIRFRRQHVEMTSNLNSRGMKGAHLYVYTVKHPVDIIFSPVSEPSFAASPPLCDSWPPISGYYNLHVSDHKLTSQPIVLFTSPKGFTGETFCRSSQWLFSLRWWWNVSQWKQNPLPGIRILSWGEGSLGGAVAALELVLELKDWSSLTMRHFSDSLPLHLISLEMSCMCYITALSVKHR